MGATFPSQFRQGLKSQWQRRKYQKLERFDKRPDRVARFGSGSEYGSKCWFKLRSICKLRVPSFGPVRIFARIRNACVKCTLSVPGKVSTSPKPLLNREVQKAGRVKSVPGEFEKKLVHEIYKSVMATIELELQLDFC